MKSPLNRRRCVLYALFIGCLYALMLFFSDEHKDTFAEFITSHLAALALLVACGWPLCHLTKKWEAFDAPSRKNTSGHD